MGRQVGGPNGLIIGKVGSIIGSSRNGIPYVKGPYEKRTSKVSAKELANRKKFAAAQAWLKPLLDIVREGFRGYSQRSYGFSAAKSWLLKNAFVKHGDELRIDPALVKVSSGDLSNPENMEVSVIESRALKFTWTPEKTGKNSSDQIMMLAYNVEEHLATYKTTGQFRSAGEDTLVLKRSKGKKFHVYAAFIASDRSRQSESVYLGEWQM
ncbi:MAG: DUF6266 family protein [Chitinophagales bacterium]